MHVCTILIMRSAEEIAHKGHGRGWRGEREVRDKIIFYFLRCNEVKLGGKLQEN